MKCSDEISIGEYFRSKSVGMMKFVYGTTYITKDNKEDYIYYLKYENNRTMPLNIKGLRNMKHSKDIIDLVQKGDYVNGKRVVYIDTIEDGDGNKRLCVFVEETQDCIEQNEIKSIVTKEQIKQIEFRIK